MKRAAFIVIGLLGFLLAVALVLPFLIDANQFRPRLEAELTTALGRDVKLGDLKVSLFAGGITASDLSIAEGPIPGEAGAARTPFIKAKSLKVGVELQPLIFSRKLIVTGIEIDSPVIQLIQSNSGVWNFASLGAKSAARQPPAGGGAMPDLTVKLVKIANGTVLLQMPGDPPKTLDKVDVEVKDFSAGAEFPFTLAADIRGGGDVKLNGKAGPINANDASETPFNVTLKLNRLDLAKSGFVRPATGFAGVMSVDGSVASNQGDIAVKGAIQAERLKLAKGGKPATKAVGFDFALHHDMKKRSGTLTSGRAHIGSAQAQLTGSYRAEGPLTFLNMKLAAPRMDVQELTAMLPALDIVLPRGSSLQGGTAAVNVTVEGPTDKLVSSGSFAVQKTRLAGFDLGSNMKTVAQLTGMKIGPDTDFDNVSAGIHAAPDGVRVETISVIAPAIGELSGSGTVSPNNALAFKMNAKLHTGGVLNILNPAGQTTVPFFIQGTSSDPKFVPDVKGMVGGMAAEKLKPLTDTDVGKAATGIMDIFKRKKPN